MKVLLIHPPWMRFFGSRLGMPPLALNSIAAYLKRALPDVELDVYNADFSTHAVPSLAGDVFTSLHSEYRRRLQDPQDEVWQEVAATLRREQPDVVGVSSMTASFPAALMVARIARQTCPQARIVLGGRHPSALPRETLAHPEVDLVVIGEGEETFRDLLAHLDHPDQVPGLAFRTADGTIRETVPRSPVRDIDSLPIPLFPSRISRYEFEDRQAPERFTWTVLSARGCPFQCVYCASDKLVRFRTPEHVMEEIRAVKREYGITSFCFEDDTFTLRRDRLERMCQLLRAEQVTWHCNTRVDFLDEKTVIMMKDSGCREIYIGIETGSARTMKAIRKNIDLAQVEKALHLLKRHHILVAGFFIIGFPWETAKDMRETVDLIERLPLDLFQLNLATPLPGTPLFEDLRRAGKIDPATVDWTQFHQGSLAMNFSRYPQVEWETLLRKCQARAYHILRRRFLFATLRRLFRDPRSIFGKILDRVRRNPALMGWFVQGGGTHTREE